MKKTLAILALGIALLLPAALRAEQGEAVVQGAIEQIDNEGRLRVGGQYFVVDQDTYITDATHRTVTRGELTRGIQVEITYYQTSRGEYAKEIIATLMR